MSLRSTDRQIHLDDRTLLGRVGAVTAICGAVLSVLSFFTLPYVSALSFSVTGADLAGLSVNTRQLIYGNSGGEWLLAWWLIPPTAVAAIVAAILGMWTPAPARKALAALLAGMGATATVALLAAFIDLKNKIISDIAGSAVEPGSWLTVIGMLAIAAGGVALYPRHTGTAAEPAAAAPDPPDWPTEPHSPERTAPHSPERTAPHSPEATAPIGAAPAQGASNSLSHSPLSENDHSQFGPYRLESMIGQGAMGQVYRAVDTVRGRAVALKLLPTHLAANPEFRARFQAESALAAQLREPHIVPIHDFGEIDGRLFIDMRLVEGVNLAQLLAQHGPLSAERAVNVVTQVASALDAAHAADLAHRDIKPSNILVTNSENGSVSEFVYVADFGLARLTNGEATSLTRTGATVGSLGYMAPERFTGGHGDHRGDIYALGCLLFEALTAHWPFQAEGLPAIIHAHLHQPPPRPSQDRPDLPADLDTVIARAMAKNPDDRYPSAGALAAAARGAVLSPSTPQAVVSEPTATTVPFSRQETVVPDRQPVWTDPGGQRAHHPRQAASTIYHPAHAQQQRRSLPRRALITGAVVALVAAIIGGSIVLLRPGPAAVQGFVREPVRTPGANPFMPPAGDDTPGVTPPPGTGGPFDGNTAGLYGGTLNNSTCDRQKMIEFLQAHPDKGGAWAGVQGINLADLPSYLSRLTPTFLRSDTAVTNHGFADGRATTLNSVLQRGNAVLVDEYGVPRARCYCGNPLTPASTPATDSYVGPTWPDFSPISITTVTPASVGITEFTLVNPFTNEIFYRPAGTTGDRDRPRTPPPANTPEAPPPPAPPEPPRAVLPPVPPQLPPVQPQRPPAQLAPPEPRQPWCPRGYKRDGHTCQPIVVECQRGYKPHGGTCQPIDECQRGYKRHGNGGTCQPIHVCPDGHRRHGDGGTCQPQQQHPKPNKPNKPECNYDDGTSKGCGSGQHRPRDPDRRPQRDSDRHQPRDFDRRPQRDSDRHQQRDSDRRQQRDSDRHQQRNSDR